jgi:hypothetical protein
MTEAEEIKHRFVLYGDCCSGVPGKPFAENFARVNAALQATTPSPDFMLFLGDHISGLVSDADELRKQWRYWLDTEMKWADPAIPIYHSTSNHNTFDDVSRRVWREVFPNIPRNGRPGQEGMSFWVRHGDLLIVMADTTRKAMGHLDAEEIAWVDAVLQEHNDARYRFVAGHYPMFGVNGYDDRPLWCVPKKEAGDFWDVLVRHGVLAYLCSHIIAFDIQEQHGVLQVCTGGAGTNYGPGGFMGDGEYHHFVRATLNEHAFILEVIDSDGFVRERLAYAC